MLEVLRAKRLSTYDDVAVVFAVSYEHLGAEQQRMFRSLGAHPEELDSHRAALEIAQRQQDYRCSAICLANIGRTLLVLGDVSQARTHLEKALARSREIGERNEEASNLTTLGTALSLLDAHDEAVVFLRAGLESAEELGNVDYTVRGLIELADFLRSTGFVDEAFGRAGRALDLLVASRAVDHLASAHNVLGAIAVERGSRDSALDHCSTAFRLASQIQYSRETERAASALRLLSASSGGEPGPRP